MKGCFNINHDSCINALNNVLMGFNGPFFGHYAECFYLIYTVCVIHILQNGIKLFTFIQKVTILPNYIPFACQNGQRNYTAKDMQHKG